MTLHPKIGILTFHMPQNASLDRYAKHAKEATVELAGFLKENQVVAVHSTQWFPKGIQNESQLASLFQQFEQEKVEAVLVEMYDIPPAKLFLKAMLTMPTPFALYGTPHPSLKSALGLIRGGQLIWENLRQPQAISSHRFWGIGRYLLRWIRGMSALYNLRKGTFVIFSEKVENYSEIEYEFLTHNLEALVSIATVQDILKRIETIPEEQVDYSLDYLHKNGLALTDLHKVSPKDVRHQIKFVLAFEQWVLSSGIPSINTVGFDTSAQKYLKEIGANLGFLSTFFPYLNPGRIPLKYFPIIGEVDETLLFTSALLSRIAFPIPAFCGSVHLADTHSFLISSPWGAPAYYATGLAEGSSIFSNISLQKDCGSGWGITPGFEVLTGEATVATLAKLPGSRYIMQIGEGWSREITSEIRQNIQWGTPWPRLAIDLGVRPYLLIQTLGSPFVSVVMKRNADEIRVVCEQLRVPVIAMDSEQSIKEFRDTFRTGRVF
ncbi:MAG: hypothetical protein GXO76_10055 [Calditrichaeota bacterium]|nr:hypothetical protein [Calditrichota bacterium]